MVRLLPIPSGANNSSSSLASQNLIDEYINSSPSLFQIAKKIKEMNTKAEAQKNKHDIPTELQSFGRSAPTNSQPRYQLAESQHAVAVDRLKSQLSQKLTNRLGAHFMPNHAVFNVEKSVGSFRTNEAIPNHIVSSTNQEQIPTNRDDLKNGRNGMKANQTHTSQVRSQSRFHNRGSSISKPSNRGYRGSFRGRYRGKDRGNSRSRWYKK